MFALGLFPSGLFGLGLFLRGSVGPPPPPPPTVGEYFPSGHFPSGLFGNGLFFRVATVTPPPPPPPPPPPTLLPFQDVPRGRLAQVEGWNAPPGSLGAYRKYFVASSRDRISWESIDNDEGAQFFMSPLEEAYALMTERDVIVFQYDPVANGPDEMPPQARFDVFRMSEVDSVHGAQEAIVQITARGMAMDLADSRFVFLDLGGYRAYEFTDTRTPYDWIVEYVIPALRLMGITWVDVGEVEPLQHVTLVVNRWNAMETMRQLASATTCEWQLRHDGYNGLLLDLKTTIGDEATLRMLREGKNLPRLRARSSAIEMLTRALPIGAKGHSPFSRTIQGLRWKVGALSPLSSSIEVVAIDGSAIAAVRIGDQYTVQSGLPVGWSIVNVRTLRTHHVLDSAPYPSTLQLHALGGLAVGDEIEFREGIEVPQTFRVDERAPGNSGIYPARISSIGANVLTVVEHMSGDPVPTNNAHVDDLCEISQFVAQVSVSALADVGNGVTRVTCASTATIAAGMWGYLSSASAEPWGAAPLFLVTAIVSATQFDCIHKFAGFTGAPYTALSGYNKARFHLIRDVAVVCTAENATANTITVDDPTNLAVTDLLTFYREPLADLAGVIPAGPASIGTYGLVERGIEKDQLRGEHNLLALLNPVFEDWTGSLPTGYTASGTITKATTQLIGPATLHNAIIAGGASGWLQSGVFRMTPTAGTLFVHCRFWFKIPNATSWTGNGVSIAAQVFSSSVPSVLAHHYFIPQDATVDPAPGNSEKVDPDTLVEYTLTVQISHASAGHPLWKGLVMRLRQDGAPTTRCGGFAAWQDAGSVPPEDGYFHRDSDALALFDAAHPELDEANEPDITYEAAVHDVARIDPQDYDLELRKGVAVQVDNETVLGALIPTVRIVKVVRYHDRLTDSKVTLDKLPDSLVRRLAEALREA